MRHNKKTNHLSRTSSHRQALLANMSVALIQEKRIVTTLAKAKALRVYVEPIITRSKVDNLNNRRMVFRSLQNKEAVTELFEVIAPKVAERPGGYTRILKLGRRRGDDTMTCFIELVDFNDVYTQEGKTKSTEKAGAKKTRRSRRKKSSSSEAPAAAAEETAKVEEPAAKAEETPAEEPAKAEEAPAAEEEAK
jgi:large subunit ribosomal protein L17